MFLISKFTVFLIWLDPTYVFSICLSLEIFFFICESACYILQFFTAIIKIVEQETTLGDKGPVDNVTCKTSKIQGLWF